MNVVDTVANRLAEFFAGKIVSVALNRIALRPVFVIDIGLFPSVSFSWCGQSRSLARASTPVGLSDSYTSTEAAIEGRRVRSVRLKHHSHPIDQADDSQVACDRHQLYAVENSAVDHRFTVHGFPLCTVLRERPIASAMAEIPPYPIAIASLAAQRLRPRSSKSLAKALNVTSSPLIGRASSTAI